jgi:flagellar basal body-associated protein FliL
VNYDNSAKKKKKTILIICLVIISLIAVGGAIFFFSAKKKSQKESPVNEKKPFTEKVKTDLKDYLSKIKNNQTSPQLSYLLLDQNW